MVSQLFDVFDLSKVWSISAILFLLHYRVELNEIVRESLPYLLANCDNLILLELNLGLLSVHYLLTIANRKIESLIFLLNERQRLFNRA